MPQDAIFATAYHAHNNAIEPSPRLNIIESGYYDLKLPVEILVEVLDSSCVRNHSTSRHLVHDKFSSSLRFSSSDIFSSEQELSIEIADIDCVKVCHKMTG